MIQGLAIKILFKTISKIVEKIDDNKMAKAHDKRLRALEEISHPPVFTSKDKEGIIKRITQLEKKEK